ncbi:MAG: hypothetical protein IJ566_02365 [Cardiobacteriaceae bacterium]|nr:hypothetical protein [Cardiobacteriaceae bacterium]
MNDEYKLSPCEILTPYWLNIAMIKSMLGLINKDIVRIAAYIDRDNTINILIFLNRNKTHEDISDANILLERLHYFAANKFTAAVCKFIYLTEKTHHKAMNMIVGIPHLGSIYEIDMFDQ